MSARPRRRSKMYSSLLCHPDELPATLSHWKYNTYSYGRTVSSWGLLARSARTSNPGPEPVNHLTSPRPYAMPYHRSDYGILLRQRKPFSRWPVGSFKPVPSNLYGWSPSSFPSPVVGLSPHTQINRAVSSPAPRRHRGAKVSTETLATTSGKIPTRIPPAPTIRCIALYKQ